MKKEIKSIATVICLLLFLCSHTVFTYYLANVPLSHTAKNLWRAINYSFIIASVYVLLKVGVTNYVQSQFLEITFFVVFFSLLITIITTIFLLPNPYTMMKAVDIGSILATLMVSISAKRYGFLKN